MKVDSPIEENEEISGKQKKIFIFVRLCNKRSFPDNAINEKGNIAASIEINESQICSPVLSKSVLTASRLSQTNPFASKSNVSTNKSVLRPSILTSNVNSTTKPTFALNPSRLNPFVKGSNDDGKDNCDNTKVEQKSTSNGDSLKFVPLIQTDNKVNENIVKPVTSNLAPVQTNPTFVFGQNLQERVISDKNSEEPTPSTSLTSNGTSEMLFSSAMKDKVRPETEVNKETKSLSESAREYEESRANKRKYEEVEVRTGEEGETNVMHLSCKLFAFDKAGSWQERGRGNLRLNDLDVEDSDKTYTQSRLVFRTSGSLRVILNTKVIFVFQSATYTYFLFISRFGQK